ncbi:PLP-dependent aminotransferase family protein [Paludibacterium purpuratum]|uniref:Putative 8-amino-7-oxononanoate synthase n=1 Tax=Paludibacterium purpuratum TaxID=1144873 RepID=A0A4R7AYZ5_9NEIS|nr:PLP-dependent aminotransferase family protein [Paludibacterium purpuratum]TDR73317.1 valine-pyruvate aminotransferase [Paludibacterium purpuratum]
MPLCTLSRRALQLKSSAIREILKITEQPDVISFAGGLPNPATFPVAQIRDAADRVLVEQGANALQYSPTEGYAPLRAWIAERHSLPGAPVSPEQVLLTTGSQQALDLLGKVLIDPGSRVLVETPTYLGAIQAFGLYEPHFVSVPSDDDGLVPESLDDGLCHGARFLYTLPSFQNPTGRLMPLDRRQALVERAARLGLPLVEDNPYGDLCYDGAPLPTLRELNPHGVVYLGSFSKILAPGLRLGYVIAETALIGKLVQAKQAADLHTPSFTQIVAHQVVKDGYLSQHIPQVCQLYATQCQAMLQALEAHMPAGVHWNRPRGGMFLWLALPEGMRSLDVLQRALAEKVAFVPGEPFYTGAPDPRTLRLSFVTVPPARIEEGVARLGRLLGA